MYIGSLTEMVVKRGGLFVVCSPGVLLHVYSYQTKKTQVMFVNAQYLICLSFSFISFHFNSLIGHLVPYKHQRQVPNILEIIHVATLVRAHTHAHTHTYTHTYTHMTVSAIVAGIDITQYT